MDHILSALSTMTRPYWVAPRAWLGFIELDKAVVLVWLDWLVFCEYGFSVSALYALLQYLRNGVAIMVNKRVWNAVLGCNLKNHRMISVRLQGKPFNITVIQVYAPTSNAEEAEVERFYEGLQDLLELTTKKDVLFIKGDSMHM